MKTIDQKATNIKLKDIQSHPRNPNRGDIEAVKASIGAMGFFGRVIVQKSTGHILAGNHRFEAAKALGAKTIPAWVVDVDDLTALKILLVDNRAASLAEADEDKLAAALKFLAEGERGLEGTGFKNDDLEALLGRAPSLADVDRAWPDSVRQIVVPCDVDEFEEVLVVFSRIQEATGVETNAEALTHLLAQVEI